MATANESEGEAQDDVGAVGVDENELIKQWTIFVGGLFAAAGVGYGLLWFVIDALDEAIIEFDGPEGLAAALDAGFLQLFLSVPGFLAVSLAAFVGAAIAYKADSPDDTVFKLVGASVLVGTILAWVLAVFLATIALDGISADFGGLLQNAIGGGIVAAVIGVLGAWLVRNQNPDSEADLAAAGASADD